MTRPRVIFVNGAFGAGKTSVVKELTAIDPRFVPYNPEPFGIVLQRLAPRCLRPEDFQNLGIWRAWVAKAIELRVKILPNGTIVVPMTLIAVTSRKTIIDATRVRWPCGVIEVWLRVSEETLRERLTERDGLYAQWALQRLESCKEFSVALPADIDLIDGEAPPTQVADAIRRAADHA